MNKLSKFLLLASSFIVHASCASNRTSSRNYPEHWWKPVPTEGAPAWEVLPQAAKSGEVILSKRNELGILSNFAPTRFELHGHDYASVEGLWQSMLFPENQDDPRAKFPGIKWEHTRAEVERMTGFDAKHAGEKAKENMKAMGIDWVSFDGKRFPYKSQIPGEHYAIIVEAMRAKLTQNPEVRDILLATGNLRLLPDHKQEPDSPPEWRYFEIWEQLRKELQAK